MESMTTSLAGAILARSGKFLLGKRSQSHSWYAGVWDIFGGHVEPGETPEEALSRECQEELGIVPALFKLYTIAERQTGPELTRFYIFFVTGWTGGEPANCSDEHSGISWFSRTELDSLELAAPEYLDLIDGWIKEQEA